MVVRLSTDLPIPAETGWALIQKAALLRYVMRGLVGFTGDVPDRWPGEGASTTVRLWLFGLVPVWKHTIRFVRLADLELQTNESGGPIGKWNHAARFEPLSARACRYTDEVEIQAGALTPLVWAWAHLQFRYRQRRWRGLARVLA